jgi:hypothetical protein
MYLPAEKDILKAQLALYATKSLGYTIAPSVSKIGSNYDKYVNSLFALSLFTSEEKLMAFLDLPSEGMVTNDPIYMLSNDLILHLSSKSDEIAKAQNDYQEHTDDEVANLTKIQYRKQLRAELMQLADRIKENE